SCRSSGGRLALPREAGGEDNLVPRSDELQVADREARPAEDVEGTEERGRRNPHLELVAVRGRDLDAEDRRDEEVDVRAVRAPAADRLARPPDLLRVDCLRVLELGAHV